MIEAKARGISATELSKMVIDEAIVASLMDNDWNQSEAAREVQVHRNTMTRHLKRWAETVGEWLK